MSALPGLLQGSPFMTSKTTATAIALLQQNIQLLCVNTRVVALKNQSKGDSVQQS